MITNLYHTYKRYRTIKTDVIRAMPLVILMPHSACNCRCVMCDIWKDNSNLKQLTEDDVKGLLTSLNKLGVQQVLMSGGEALLNPNFFKLCSILKQNEIKISLLSTGLTLKRNAEQVVGNVNDVIVSLDGNESTHNKIRNLLGAYYKLSEGVQAIKSIDSNYRVTGRTVIHNLNYTILPEILISAKDMGLNQISFLPADVSSHAFNREILWDKERQSEVLIAEDDLPKLKNEVNRFISDFSDDFNSGFIAESPEKFSHIYDYYAAFYGLNDFPYKKCNAPWVSTVIEADGTVRPCFFHESYGNIKEGSFESIINSPKAIAFRKGLDISKDPTCIKCVCSLNLSPYSNF